MDDGRAEDLELDQQKYPPQHKPGDPQGLPSSIVFSTMVKISLKLLSNTSDFNADQKRIDYFKKVLAVKLDKVLHIIY